MGRAGSSSGNSVLRSSARDTCVRLLESAGIAVGGTDASSIQVHDERMWELVFADRELALGETYMDGWWDADAPDEVITRILTADLREAIRPSPKLMAAMARAKLQNRQTVGRARRNAQHHYDIGNDLYERMLDERMVYSCAYWADQPDPVSNDLAAAQVAKLDLICRKLHLEPGMRLLDIGCGWGGLSRFAAERYGVSVVGISPAVNQVARAREVCAGLDVEIREQDYRQLTGNFDRVVSVGMMEHVGAKNLAAFFRQCGDLLAPDGMMLHHTIGSLVTKDHTDPWIDKYIFPGGLLPSMGQISDAFEPSWVIEDVHNFGPDYDRTLMCWLANVDAAWGDLPAYDERFRRMWRYYLCLSAAGFRARRLQLWQLVIRRTGRASRYEPVR